MQIVCVQFHFHASATRRFEVDVNLVSGATASKALIFPETLSLSILLPETCQGNKLSSFTLLIIRDHRALKMDLGFRCLGKSRDFL
jgi:hypothetical protein